MTLQLLYWILMLLWLVGIGHQSYQAKSIAPANVLLFLILLVLGWAQFGQPITNA